MTIQKLWITDDPHDGITAETKAAADEAGATQILSGIPHNLAADIDSATRGYVELTIPDPEPPDTTVPEQVRFDAFADTLDAELTGATNSPKIVAAFRKAIAAGRNVV